MMELNEDSNGSSSTTSSVFEATSKYIENNSDLLQKMHRTESRSVSNDSSSVISNQNIVVDENSSSSSTMPKLGLKLVLKRHSGDKYEVKTNNPNYTPLSASTSLLINTPNTDLLSSRRPKREAARKVKFTFSESEYDLDDIPIRKKSRLTSQSLNTQQPTPTSASNNYILKQQNKKQQNINYKTSTKTTTNINNNVKIVISESNNTITPLLPTPPPPPPPTQLKFERSDLVPCSIDDKISIIKEQPFIIIKQSKPFPIALVEDKTNVVYTKALLFLHLFKSYSSQCIYCPWCRLFLSVGEFSKHLHLEDLDEEEDEEDESSSSYSDLSSNEEQDEQEDKYKKKQLKKLNKLKQKSFKILPYCTNLQQDGDDKLSESDIQTWKTFGSRFAQFKSIRNEQQKKEKELALLIRKQDDSLNQSKDKKYLTIQAQHISLLSRNNRTSSGSVSSSTTNITSPSLNNQSKSKIETFDDWDQIDKEKKVYYLSKGKIDYEKVTYLKTNGDRLSESEYEEDEEDVDLEGNRQKTTQNLNMPKNNSSIKPKNDFTLSESEDEDDKLDHALSEEDEHENKETKIQEQLQNDNKSSHEHLEQSNDKTNNKNINSIDNNSHGSTDNINYYNNNYQQKLSSVPTIIQRYFNLYDNQSKSLLAYMSKNQFTILPISYLNYYIRKKQIFSNKLKLANTISLKTLWLCLTLDLECNNSIQSKFKI